MKPKTCGIGLVGRQRVARKLILEAGTLEMHLVERSHRMPGKAESVPTEPKAQSTGLVYYSGLSREIKTNRKHMYIHNDNDAGCGPQIQL